MLWGIYSAIYGEVNVSVEKRVEIRGETMLKNSEIYCHLRKLVRPETFGPYGRSIYPEILIETENMNRHILCIAS